MARWDVSCMQSIWEAFIGLIKEGQMSLKLVFLLFGREIPVSTYRDQPRRWRTLTQGNVMSSKLADPMDSTWQGRTLTLSVLVYGPVFLKRRSSFTPYSLVRLHQQSQVFPIV